ncbi:hypothetical protein [Endozoicomonas lisbonensis]
MSLIGCKQITVQLTFFLLFLVAVDRTFAQNISTTPISTVTVLSTLSSLVLAAKHNLALCDTKVNSKYRSACRNIVNKLPPSTIRYNNVTVYTEGWFSTAISAKTANSIHIIYGDLTLAGSILVFADNVVIAGSGNPQLTLSSTIWQGLHTIIYSTGKNLFVDGLQIDPRGLILHHLSHVLNHFIHIKGGSASISNVSIKGAEAAAKSIILAEGKSDTDSPASLTLTDVEIRDDDGENHSYALETSGINSITLERVKTHNFTSNCALFSFENAHSIKMATIQSRINNQKAPNSSGILAIYTQPSSDVKIDFEDVSFSYKVTTHQSPVIIAAKDTISGQLSLAGKNSFDQFAVRYPTGLTVSVKPQEKPTGIVSTESTTANTSTINTVTTTPYAPEYWWSDLPDCASTPYQEYQNSTASTDWNSTPGSTRTEWPVTATPYLSTTSSVATISSAISSTITPATTTAIDSTASSIQPGAMTTTVKPGSSTLKTESISAPTPGTTKPSSVVHSSPHQTTGKPAPSSRLTPDQRTSSAISPVIKNRSTPSLSTRPDVNKDLTTLSPNVTEGSHSEAPNSDTKGTGGSTSQFEWKYMSFLSSLIIPAGYALAFTGCLKLKNKKACKALNILLANCPECLKWQRYMFIMYADLLSNMEMGEVGKASETLCQNPEEPLFSN